MQCRKTLPRHPTGSVTGTGSAACTALVSNSSCGWARSLAPRGGWGNGVRRDSVGFSTTRMRENRAVQLRSTGTRSVTSSTRGMSTEADDSNVIPDGRIMLPWGNLGKQERDRSEENEDRHRDVLVLLIHNGAGQIQVAGSERGDDERMPSHLPAAGSAVSAEYRYDVRVVCHLRPSS